MTGDMLYPGLLYIEEFADYRASVERLCRFVEANPSPVAHILGAHIEMKSAPGKFFGYPHPFLQEGEHVLQLERGHLFELRDVVRGMSAAPGMVRRPDFIVFHDAPSKIPPEDP